MPLRCDCGEDCFSSLVAGGLYVGCQHSLVQLCFRTPARSRKRARSFSRLLLHQQERFGDTVRLYSKELAASMMRTASFSVLSAVR